MTPMNAQSSEIDRQIELLMKCELPDQQSVNQLCAKACEVLKNEANVQRVDSPVVICGDVHGQFWDLLKLFNEGGRLPDANYIFLGDFVDRGLYSIETFLLLIALKVRFPDRITLIRGNHESRGISSVYGFYDECLQKYSSPSVWRSCANVFDCLSLGVIVDDQVFCVHGGLSPHIKTIDEIRKIDRHMEVPHQGPMCDMLWSDPEEAVKLFATSPRGAGYLFGAAVVEQFCESNNIELIARAHQLVMEGFKYHFDKRMVTIWSAPNYCYRCKNVAAIMKLDENLARGFIIFESAEQEMPITPIRLPQRVPEYFI